MDRPLSYTGKLNKRRLIFVACLITAVAVISAWLTGPVHSDTPSACVLKWSIIDTPGGYLQRNDVISPCEINALAVSPSGQYIYAVDVPNSSSGPVVNAGIWKSIDGGISWSPRPTRWLARAKPAPVFPVSDIAIAPDNPEFVAVVCMDAAGTRRREVYFSEDGGTNWVYSGKIPWLYGASEQIGKIAISIQYPAQENNVRDIIIGSRDPTDGLARGEVYVLSHPGMAGWKGQMFSGGDIICFMPSPSYPYDPTLVIMSSTTQRTYLNMGYRDTGGNTCSWDTAPGWPVELCTSHQKGGTASGENKIITGALAMPTDYEGNTPSKRIVFASYDSNGTSQGPSQLLDDVYRLNDTTVTQLKIPGYGNNPRICSISYTGTVKSGKLLAGGVAADTVTAEATVWATSNPLDNCPIWNRPLKHPTGGYNSGYANVLTAWTGDGTQAMAGTGSGNRDTPLKWANPTDASWNAEPLDESAFSVSLDNVISWNQLGLIDTQVNRFRSFAAGEDGSTAYIASVNDNGLDSNWRSHTTITGDCWQRVLCLDCSAPLLRVATDKPNGSTIFIGNQGTIDIKRSCDSGQTWQNCPSGIILQDMGPARTDELYVLQANGLFRHGVYDTAGWSWDKYKDTGLSPAHSMAVQNNNILVGAALGQICPVSYSFDKGNTWTLITQQTYSSGNRHPTFDVEFKDNRIIYLADDAGGLYRWSIGTSNRWDDMEPPHHSYYGAVAGGSGVFYGAYSPSSRGVDRTIYSRAGIPKSGVSWDSLTTGLGTNVVFSLEPNSLVHSRETIWAIDARDFNPAAGVGCLWAFRDTLAEHSPWLIAPKANSLVNCDPVTGRNAQVDLKWQQLSLASHYEIEIAKDKWLDLLVDNASPAVSPFYSPSDLLYPAYYIPVGALPEAGRPYWWRVRVRRAATGQNIRSHWSYALTFSVRPGFMVAMPSYPGIQSLSPCHEACDVPVHPVSFSWSPVQGATHYKFVLAEDPALNKPIIDEQVQNTGYRLFTCLSYNTSYFWQVTPMEPVPGDPSPVFSFNTEKALVPPTQIIPQGISSLEALMIAGIVVILVGLWVQVIFFRRRNSR
ncbi:MAG: hypothetical protein JW901_12640 [Dehalococcoidia bacterium]|nr:hypothetical protein [Dehalococcoidia bacterium]